MSLPMCTIRSSVIFGVVGIDKDSMLGQAGGRTGEVGVALCIIIVGCSILEADSCGVGTRIGREL